MSIKLKVMQLDSVGGDIGDDSHSYSNEIARPTR